MPHMMPDALKKREVLMKIDKDYSPDRIVVAKKQYNGYKEDDEINEWLSHVFEEQVMLLRA